jgi:hypothetical protein
MALHPEEKEQAEERDTGRAGDESMKAYAFSQRKRATKPPFSRKRKRHCIQKRRSKQKIYIYRKSRIRIGEAVCIQSKKVCYECTIQTEAKPTLRFSRKRWRSEETHETGYEKEKETDQRRHMLSVEETPLRNRHSDGSETRRCLRKRRSKLKRELDRKKERGE